MSPHARGFTRFFLVPLLLALILPFHADARIPIGYPPLWLGTMTSFPQIPYAPWGTTDPDEVDILVDDFEYWASPLNQGWQILEPSYPTYGFGLGFFSVFATVLDLQQGSRVLDVQRPGSVFLLSTLYERQSIRRPLFTPPSLVNPEAQAGISLSENPILGFDFRAPMGIEIWDIFDLTVTGEGCGRDVNLRLIPLQPPSGAGEGIEIHTASGMYRIVPVVSAARDDFLGVDVYLGRGFLDGSWHTIQIDCTAAVEDAVKGEGLDPADWCMDQADAIVVSGQMMFRLDNISFMQSGSLHQGIEYPDLFEMGPLYAQIFVPYRFLFIADYKGKAVTVYDDDGQPAEVSEICDLMLNPGNFLFPEDPNDPNDPLVRYWTDLGADPNLFGTNDPNMAALFGRAQFTVDLRLPIFADPNMRMTPQGPGPSAQPIIGQGILGWNATVGGYGATGTEAFLLSPLAIYPYDGMPTYLPEYYDAVDLAKATGKPFYRPDFVFILEAALWNAGFTVWPMIAALDFEPQYFEDLIVTIEVTDGVHSDVRTFPICVVNYPMENYPPVAQLTIEDQIFYVGKKGECLVNFIDPDCFIFSLAQPAATSHTPGFPISTSYRTDMEGLYWGGYIDGYPAYTYGPWHVSLIDPCSGLISFVPRYEAVHDMIVFCADARGGTSFGDFYIFALSMGTWLNHPPIILGRPSQPVVIRAGEELVLMEPDIRVEEPDGDELYASCNIGTCGRAPDGSFIWKFQSNFPGTYLAEIVFYDIRGGYAQMQFLLDVKPWWSY